MLDINISLHNTYYQINVFVTHLVLFTCIIYMYKTLAI